jgi:hypothetical protein
MNKRQVGLLRERLEYAIRDLPEGFFDTFDFVRGRTNLCHPITVGLIARILAELPGIGYLGFDVRLNDGNRHKFQPDLVGYRDANGVRENQPIIFVDFESPNSSDARVPRYHLLQYLQWVRHLDPRPPYVIVTCLPDATTPKWRLLYKSGRRHSWHKANVEKIRANPFRYWTSVWRDDLRKGEVNVQGIFFFNIDGRRVISFNLV